MRSAHVDGVCVDVDRAQRCGFPEVVFAEGKPPETVVGIFQRLLERDQDCLATRVSAEQADLLRREFPRAIHNQVARTVRIDRDGRPASGRVVVVTAGTSDRPVAEEALETLRWMHCDCELIVDVGVAGPHRLPEHLGRLRGADAVVVVAGMEGALPSVVGGWVDCPVIAVPTSVGYGASFGGLAALLGMLNSCAANVTVVNIDAGFKAGFVAGLIATRARARGGREPAESG
jgi:NCAIR mutase (PurE)-related protein